MKTLLILRHAKSSWADPGLADHDRPLNARGKRDAPRMGQLLKDQGLVPDLIVSSTAKRARKTAAKVAEACGYDGEIAFSSHLYHAYPEDYVSVLREVGDTHRSVLVVGHNPGLEEFVEVLAGTPQTMPTAALAHVPLDIDCWDDLRVAPLGRLAAVWIPKELP
jgi:phosphohistidine phosphatase